MLIVLGLLTLAGDDRRVTESTARPVTIGFVHGLAGSAAVATLPQVALIPDPVWAVGYLAVFGAGTIAGMMLDHRLDRRAVADRAATVRLHAPHAADRVGGGEHRVRSLPRPPHRLRGRPVHDRARRGRRSDGARRTGHARAARRAGECAPVRRAAAALVPRQRARSPLAQDARSVSHPRLGADAAADAGVARRRRTTASSSRPSRRCTTWRARGRSV